MQIALKCPKPKGVWGLGSCGISNLHFQHQTTLFVNVPNSPLDSEHAVADSGAQDTEWSNYLLDDAYHSDNR
ncbi:hypothetical protein AVEN_209309-1 [Araneus ventricosus]|uniref:Uncharacterized protein n=1 Tax=Araneus ventricosus TaxID=182803 RepID=A0A4Y2CCG4_ARAVE|nr:hypothetical protein AVEN_209309-1 [Araneus ventricosus]